MCIVSSWENFDVRLIWNGKYKVITSICFIHYNKPKSGRQKFFLLVESSRELRKLTSFNTSGKWTQVGQALVVQKHFIRFRLNYRTITLIFPLFLMDLDLTTREFDTTLHVDKSLKIEAELGKFTELYIFHQGLAARLFSVMTFPMVPTFQLCWFGWNRPPQFFKNTLWNWSVFACLIELC